MTSAGNGQAAAELAFKIAKLVEERGWNQEDFAKFARLNRHTVRQILNAGPHRRLRNATVSQCAEALGLTVNELRSLPIERLLPRMHGKPPADTEALDLLQRQAVLPEFVAWLARNPDRSAELRSEEIHELLAMQEPGGLMTSLGVEYCVSRIERHRELLLKVKMLASSDQCELLEQLVDLMCDKVNQNRQNNDPRSLRNGVPSRV